MLTNMSENHEDTWLILKRCLTIDDYKHSCLLIIGKAYSALLESIDNKQIVRNIFFPKINPYMGSFFDAHMQPQDIFWNILD